MKNYWNKSKSIFAAALIICLIANLFSVLSLSAFAETVLPDGGRAFDAEDRLALSQRLETQPKTYEAVFYAPSTVTRPGVLFGSYYDGDTACINFEIHSNGYPLIHLQDGKGNTVSAKFENVDARADDWVHLVVTHEVTESGAVYNCYLNGVLSDTITSTLPYELDMETVQFTHFLSLGRDNRSGNAQYFKGKIRSLALYSDVLTAKEIKASYENGVNTEDTGLMAYYQLDDTDDAVFIPDATGNGFDLRSEFYPNQNPIASADYDYSFAIVGDTQKLVYRDAYKDTDYADHIYDWIVANKDAKKINFVMGLGDITDKNGKDNTSSDSVDQTDIEWNIAAEQHKKLTDAGIPYSVIQGNHDSVAQLDTFFAGNDNFTNADIGYYSGNSLGNYYIRFTAGTEKYMVVCLQYGPTDAMVAWAGEVIRNNPDRKVIITTHAYLNNNKAIIDMFGNLSQARKATTASSDKNNGNRIWTELASQHENVIMVLSGHIPCADIKMRRDLGVHGNTVTQLLVDPQGIDPIYGYKTGLVAMLYFSNGGKTVQVEYVSTYYSLETGQDYLYDQSDNKFTFTIPETQETADVPCEYGTIDKWYSNPQTYPFVAFKTDKTFIGGYGELSDAIAAVQAKGDDSDYVIYMRKNAELRDQTVELTDFEGTITVDLGGNTLLKGAGGSVFNVHPKDNSNAVPDENGVDLGGSFVLKNGTVQKYGSAAIVTSNYSEEFANPYKASFEFSNVTFVDKNGGDYSIFAPYEGGFANTEVPCIYLDIAFNDCIFDYTNSTVPPAMLRLDNVNGYNHATVCNVEINGGKIVAPASIGFSAFATLDKDTDGRDDRITFNKGSNGKCLVLELPEGATAPTEKNIWRSGDGLMSFFADETANGYATYELQSVEGYETKYGYVPSGYGYESKKILLFRNGQLYGGYDEYSTTEKGKAGVDAFYMAKCLVDGDVTSEIGSTVQLLFQSDVEVDTHYLKICEGQGKVIVDLNGHKLIQNFSDAPLCWMQARNWKGIADSTICYINGEMVLKTPLIFFGATDSGYNNAATDTNYKNIYVNYDNIKFSYAEGATATTFLGTFGDGSKISGGKKVGYEVNFNDCSFDLTNATSMTSFMNASDNAIEKVNCIVNVNVNGGEMITAKPGNVLYEEHESNGSSVVFNAGKEDKYLTMTVTGTDEAPTATANKGDLVFKQYAATEETVTYRLTPMGTMTEYGYVPTGYGYESKKILLFQNGQLIGGYDEYSTTEKGNAGVDAFYAAKCLVDGDIASEIGSTVQLLFQSDVEVDTHYLKICEGQGKVIVDLNGHKLIQNFSDAPLCWMQARNWKGIADSTICYINGEMVLKTPLMFFGATDSAYNSAATDTNYKNVYVNYDNMKFSYAEGSTATTFLGTFGDGSSISDGKKVEFDVNFNNCIFDLTNATAMTSFMNAVDPAIEKVNSIVHVNVNGGEMITAKPGNVLYEEHESNGSSVIFNEGENGEYLTMTVIGTDEVPTATANNRDLEFVFISENDEGTTYRLKLTIAERAAEVTALITQVRPFLNRASGTAISAARTAYDGLTEKQQALVEGYEAFAALEAEYTEKAAYAIGDLDGGGEANLADVILLLQHLVGYDVQLLTFADINEDERVSIFDAVILMKQLCA